MKPQVVVEFLEMEDPTFEGGISKTARARLTNPTTKSFTYSVELYMGMTKAATSGIGNVTIPAGGSSDVNFTLTMPVVEASYPVYLDVLVDATLIAHYQATENVVIVVSPVITVGPITWL